MGAQAQARVGGDGIDAARVGVQAGGLAADGAHGVGGGQVGVALRGQAGVLSAEQADAGRGDPAGAGRGVKVQQGLTCFATNKGSMRTGAGTNGKVYHTLGTCTQTVSPLSKGGKISPF